MNSGPSRFDVIIPTLYPDMLLGSCIQSLLECDPAPDRVLIVNNSKNKINVEGQPAVHVIDAGGNKGWEGGLDLGLKESSAEFVVFCNDDAFVPFCTRKLFDDWASIFDADPSVAAIGPSSNLVMGQQNIWSGVQREESDAAFLIGFFVAIRRSALDIIGGVDLALPGGDDLDWSIRFRKAGLTLRVDRRQFVYHHGFVTGIKTHGDHTKPNGWNSKEMSERTRKALIAKHGESEWNKLFEPVAVPALTV